MQTVVRTLTLGVKNLLYLGRSCRYPRASTQPMTEDLVVTEGGPGDDSDLTSSHVLNLAQGIRSTYEWFLRNQDALCLSGPTPTGGQREPADERAGR